MRKLFQFGTGLLMVLLFSANFSMAQSVTLQQGQNGGIDMDPVSPVIWATGNSNSGNSHFIEGQSIPYRMTISRLRAGNHTVVIEWDTRTGNKSAIDYITSFDRICEEVIPNPGAPNFGLIPTPEGIPQPSNSFNQLSENERKIAIYGGTLGQITYLQQGDVTATSAVTRIRIPFNVIGSSGPNNTVVIAWGGHIASASDWGDENSASSISGSPYHTRVISLNGNTVGNQNRSVQAGSGIIDFDPDCDIMGEIDVCADVPISYSVPSGALSYAWSVSEGGEIVSGQGTNSINVKWTSTGVVSVNVGNDGAACLPTQCRLDVNVRPSNPITVVEAVLCSIENGGNTAYAKLFDYVTDYEGELSFFRNGSPIVIQEQDSILVTTGDKILVTTTADCGVSQTINVTVNDRQIFGICTQGKLYEPLGSELKALYEIFRRGQVVGSNELFYIDGNDVLIEVIYFKGKFDEAKPILESLDFETPTQDQLKQDPNSLILAGFLPIEKILALNNPAYKDIINYVRPAIPGIRNVGATTTQGDRVMRSNLVRAGYIHAEGDQAIDGNGIKIGVLSDSYNTRIDGGVNLLATDIDNGDLPTDLYFYRDLPSRFGRGTDEGRAMAQIVHDVAPGAQLGFRTGVITAGDFAQGIRDLAAAGSDIIVDDITYITEPFFSDGKVAKAVNEVTSVNGVSYFTSAGNFGKKSFEGVFKPVQDESIGLPLKFGEWENGGRVHEFSDGKTTQTLKVYPGSNGPAVYMIALQWDDPLYSIDQIGSKYDLDIYLKDFGTPLFGFNRNNVNGDPIEILSFTISEETTIDLVIARECESCDDLDSNKEIKFKYVVFRGEVDPTDLRLNASTVVGHANSEGAMTVGAVLYANTSVFGFDDRLVPAGTDPFTVASFSSRGGTLTNGVTRAKPDFVGPNGVNTTVDLGAPNLEKDLPENERDDFPNFFGTSAAAPHVAAVAALIKQARIKYYPETKPVDWLGEDGKSLPDDIRRVLKTSADDMHEEGEDLKSGSGLVRADKALLQLAVPKPDNLELVYEEGTDLGNAEFNLIIRGTNLYEDSEVYLDGEKLDAEYKIDSLGFGYLEVTVPLFEGNPGITVVNNPISELGTDGGTAGPVYFDFPKKTIAIRADNQTKKYGQIVEPFTASVYELAGGAWVLSTTLTLEEVGLTLDPVDEGSDLVPLILTSTITGDLAEVGTYVITASHPQTAATYTNLFNYVGVVQPDETLFYNGINNDFGNYGPGIITVQALPITITPVNLALKYGESISEALEYEVSIPAEFIESDEKVKIADVQGLKNSILSAYLQDLELAKREGDDVLPLGIFNGSIDLNRNDFINKSFMVSAATVGSGRSIINISGRTIINTSTGRSIINAEGRTIINSAFDVPAASFLDYLEDLDNQTLINATGGRTIINSGRTIINAARTIINAQSLASGRTIINTLSGSARTIINARAEINGSGRTIINSVGGGEEEQNNSLVIYGEADLELAEEVEINGKSYYDFGADIEEDESDDFNQEFFSVTMVTGTDVGKHFIIPGTLASRNLKVSYEPADLTITPASLTATTAADPVEIVYGDTAPEYETIIEGFETSTKFLDSDEIEVTLDDFESEIESLEYSLLKENVSFAPDGLIAAGVYEVNPIITLIEPSNYFVGTINRGLFTVKKATPTVIVSVDMPVIEYPNPVVPTGYAYGIGGEEDLLEQNLISFEYLGTGSTSYGPTTTAPILPGTYQVIAKFAGNENYNPANSADPASFVIVGCANVAPVMSGFETAKGSGNTNTSATIKKPEGTGVGDLLIVGLMLEKGESPDVTPPKDWVRINRVNQSNQVAMAIFFKIVTSNKEPDTYTFRISQSPKWSMGITRVVGADIDHTEGPILTFSGASGGTSFEATAPSLTTVDCNTMVMAFYTNKKNATWTEPVGMIKVYDDPNNQQGLTSNMMSYFVQTDPGETGDLTAIASLAESWVAQAIAIRPKVNNTQASRLLPPVVEPIIELPESVSALFGEEVIGELNAYPNPVRNKLNISLKGYFEMAPDDSSLILSDAMGRILSWQGSWNQKERMMELDFSTMKTGLYIININTMQGIKSIRVIKR